MLFWPFQVEKHFGNQMYFTKSIKPMDPTCSKADRFRIHENNVNFEIN